MGRKKRRWLRKKLRSQDPSPGRLVAYADGQEKEKPANEPTK